MAEDLSYIGEGTDLEPIAEEVAEEEPATPERLQEITTKAALEYSLKHFSQAAELYSTACQLQDELHGEMAPENAELFYLYGRALYKVAVQNSDVLGGQVAAEKKKTKVNGKAKKPAPEGKSGEEAAAAAPAEKAAPVAGTPYFQITGMENWDSDEEDDEDADGEAEDEEDDFATAYEILDVSRVLFERQLEGLTNGSADTDGKGKGKASGASSSDTKVKERLSDVYDLQAEISLENERFADAIPDFRSALTLKLEFHPKESSLIAEAHYKLSLALEFASVTALREAQAADGENAKVKKEDVDEDMREEAAKQMELAIESCKLRLTKEKDAMASMTGEEKIRQENSVAEVQEIVGDMEQRVCNSDSATSIMFVDAG